MIIQPFKCNNCGDVINAVTPTETCFRCDTGAFDLVDMTDQDTLLKSADVLSSERAQGIFIQTPDMIQTALDSVFGKQVKLVQVQTPKTVAINLTENVNLADKQK